MLEHLRCDVKISYVGLQTKLAFLCSLFTSCACSSPLIRPVVSYGAETWTMTKKEEQALLIFERKLYRRIYGPKYENGEWKSRTNRELEEMSKEKM